MNEIPILTSIAATDTLDAKDFVKLTPLHEATGTGNGQIAVV